MRSGGRVPSFYPPGKGESKGGEGGEEGGGGEEKGAHDGRRRSRRRRSDNKVEAAHFQLQLSFSSRKEHQILLNLHFIEREPEGKP